MLSIHSFVLEEKACKRLLNLVKNGGEKIKTYVPKCSEDGLRFEKKQCSDNQCWCVETLYGKEIEGTRKSSTVPLNCGKGYN